MEIFASVMFMVETHCSYHQAQKTPHRSIHCLNKNLINYGFLSLEMYENVGICDVNGPVAQVKQSLGSENYLYKYPEPLRKPN